MGMPARIYAMRHATAEGGVADRRSRAGDDQLVNLPAHRRRRSSQWHLAGNGPEEATSAGQWFAAHARPDRGLVSPFVRTLETAALLELEIDWTIEPLVREQDCGRLVTVSGPERDQDWYRQFQAEDETAPMFVRPPGGGETVAEVMDRIRLLLATGVHEGEHVVIVSHLWVMRALHAVVAQQTPAEYATWIRQQPLPPCSILEYRLQPSTATPRWRLIDPTQTATVSDWQLLRLRRVHRNPDLLAMARRAAPPVITR